MPRDIHALSSIMTRNGTSIACSLEPRDGFSWTRCLVWTPKKLPHSFIQVCTRMQHPKEYKVDQFILIHQYKYFLIDTIGQKFRYLPSEALYVFSLQSSLRFKYDSDLQWSRGRKFRPHDPLNNAWTDWVYLDPDRVDLIVQHKLRNMDYYELIQEAGDCIFIPYAMLHQVQKLDDGLQVAASWMFLPESIYEEDVCREAPLQEDLPLAAMDTLFMYSGKGLIPQGYQDPLNFVNKLAQYMAKSKEDYLSLQTFTRAVTEGDAILGHIRNRKKKIQKLFQRISAFHSHNLRVGCAARNM